MELLFSRLLILLHKGNNFLLLCGDYSKALLQGKGQKPLHCIIYVLFMLHRNIAKIVWKSV